MKPEALAPRATRDRAVWGATLLFALLTVAMTWPQAEWLATRARGHHDVYFNMWRLKWVAHALTTAPADLFDGNIFYPAERALTFSDAMIVEGLIATPLLLLGLPIVLVHNLLLLGAIVGSAAGMFVLTRHLTGSSGAGIAAGVVFAFVPYRFEHYMHLELQWTVWMPWAFWALHRTLETGALRYGLLTGLFVALQTMSSVYYGVFLATLFAPLSLLLTIALCRGRLRQVVPSLAAGAVAALVLCGVYALPYLATKEEVGQRSEAEIVTYSARPSNYLVATPDNVMYGRMFASRGRPERRLFPGALVVVLALVGLLMKLPAPIALAYFLGLVGAFEMSLGLSGYSYRFLYDHVVFFQGFRAVARLGIFVVFFLAVLAAFGYAAIVEGRGPRVRRIVLAIVVLTLLAEYRVEPLALVPYPNGPGPLQTWLAQQPPGVVAELPMPDLSALPGDDPRISFLSTFHWLPMVNGYSGFMPRSYTDRLGALERFPDDRALERLRRDNVRYLVVHLWRYGQNDVKQIPDELKLRHGLAELQRFAGDEGETVVYSLR